MAPTSNSTSEPLPPPRLPHHRSSFNEQVQVTYVSPGNEEDSGSFHFTDSLSRSSDSMTAERERINVFIVFVFILELLVLVFVSVLEYFLRDTDVFPVRQVNFSCTDASISYRDGDTTYSEFAYDADIPYVVIIILCFAIPPIIIVLCEIAVWAFCDESQKMVLALCRQCKLPQVFRRMVRFIGTFLFGLLATMIFTDVAKIFTGRLRPTFLETCRPNQTACALGTSFDQSICLERDEDKLREARLSFPSLHTSMTSFAAFYTAIYLHNIILNPGVRVMRPFLSLSFIILAVMCGLARIGLNRSHWTDVLAGFLLGFFVAAYIALFVVKNFHEHMTSTRLYSRLKSFLVNQRLIELRDLYKEERLERDLYVSSPHLSRHGNLTPDSYTSNGLLIPRPQVSLPSPSHNTQPNGHDLPDLFRPRTPPDRSNSRPVPPPRIPNYTNTFQRDLNRAVDYHRGQGYNGHI